MSETLNVGDWQVISAYSRAQAIEDGELVDISATKEWKESGFKFPGAMTRAAYAECISAGGEYKTEPWPDGYVNPNGRSYDRVLKLPGCQSVAGRLWDVCWMLRCAIRAGGDTDRVHFKLSVWLPPETPEEIEADGKRRTVKLWALIGPGDTAAPVMTIMLEGED